MQKLWTRLWIEADGAILSAEMILVGSALVVGSVVGLSTLRDSVVQELDDVAKALGSIDQSYSYSGVWGHGAYTAGSAFYDRADFSDSAGVAVGGPSAVTVVCSSYMAQGPVVYGPSASVAPEAVSVVPEAVASQAEVIEAPADAAPVKVPADKKPKQRPAKKPKQPAAAVEVELETHEAVVTPVPAVVPGPPVVCCADTMVLGAAGWAPQQALPVFPHQRPVRVFVDPRHPGPVLIDAPEGAFNGPHWPAMQVLVGHGGGFVDTGCCYGPVPGAVPPARLPVVEGGRIDLGFTNVGDAELRQLRGMKTVRCLHIVGTQVTDAGLAHLKGLESLETLYLLGTQVTDAGLAHLGGLKQLAALHLVGTAISDDGLARLHGLGSLKLLDLRGTRVSIIGIEALRKALPGCRVLH